MKAVIQRVKKCSVTIGGKIKSEIDPGILILLGVREDDTEIDASILAGKVPHSESSRIATER